jgi:hypothetical protein
MLWHDGYPVSMLAASARGPEGAVVVERQRDGWAVYRKRGRQRESLRHHHDVARAYGDALERIYAICRDEGI